jgi:hypothetical protein
MARIAGIRTEKDLKGNITRVTFDLKKHAAKIMPILVEMGAVEEDAFEKEWREGIPVEKFFVEWEKEIRERWKSRK